MHTYIYIYTYVCTWSLFISYGIGVRGEHVECTLLFWYRVARKLVHQLDLCRLQQASPQRSIV